MTFQSSADTLKYIHDKAAITFLIIKHLMFILKANLCRSLFKTIHLGEIKKYIFPSGLNRNGTRLAIYVFLTSEQERHKLSHL